jgi:RNA polymerase sigma factor (sigma-70 family)
MPTNVIEHIRRVVGDGVGLRDGELLGRYVDRRDEAALAALVNRHGPMVWGVCRRQLSHDDAEDAFQATFIVLVRKAASIAQREAVGNWLYGVALQTALQARRSAARRRAREVQVTEMPDAEAPQERWADLQPLLDGELSRLPDHYRTVIVLCDLEGMTRKEAARQLGIPEGSVASRLARARTLLAKRLNQRGIVLPGSVAAVLSAGSAPVSAPPSLVVSTIKAASLLAAGQAAGVVSVKVAALTEGVLKAMFLSKLKAVSLLLLVLMSCVTVGGLLHYTQAADQTSGSKSKSGGTKPLEDQFGQKPDPDKLMTAGEVLSAFDKNEAAGEDRFLDKKVRVSGKAYKVQRVSGSDMAVPNIVESDENYYLLTLLAERADAVGTKKPGGNRNRKLQPMAFVFPVSSRKQLAGIEEGQQVTIEGVCQGRKDVDLVFTGCHIVKSK